MNNFLKTQSDEWDRFYYFDYDERLEIFDEKESNSEFIFSDEKRETYHLISRQHKGDENGKTICKFAKFKIPTEYKDKLVVYVGCPRYVKVKESCSNITCSSGEVIVGRTHYGDENGYTVYQIAEVYAAVNKTIRRCMTVDTCYKEFKESIGIEAHMGGRCIVGRSHYGDENGTTTYTFGKIVVPLKDSEIK